ncbi:glycosyltransferase family 4 protein [Siccirubricoccus sp. G192]|uniref:glycosyltransferase family 4 protein n=1 Tax=Siccirubricoccus sp. G192 TaxID=2849651 RepID=UPI0020C56BB5|nr:glycosyltransferase family 4 protein [Siccirubricoccus sp. G192]
MGSPYEVEQTSFAFNLWRQIRRDCDVVHVQDPILARMLAAAHRRGLSRPRVILANGTGEAPEMLRRFDWLQHLTPGAAAAWEPQRPLGQAAFTIPNFIDPARFTPGDRLAARARLGLPGDRVVVFCCAAIRRRHKRIDVLIEEFATANRACGGRMLLVVAGGREPETAEVVALAERLLGEDARILIDVPRPEVHALYQAADLFVLPSLFEMFGMVLLEAMSCGLPVICHDTPDFHYVTGPGALRQDIARTGGLAEALLAMLDPVRRAGLAAAARRHVEENFSDAAVIPQMLRMYEAVASGPGSRA